MRARFLVFAALVLVLSTALSCTWRRGEIGSEKNPIRFLFMPLKGEEAFQAATPILEKFIEERTGLKGEATHVPDFISIVKALGQRKADIAFMNTLGYLLAHDWAKAEAHLRYIYGDVYTSYRGELLARAGSGMDSVKDLEGKAIAFVGPYSTGGYLYPMKLLKDNGVKPGRIVFAGGHKKAVQMLYDGEVDAAATYHTRPSNEGLERDGRTEIATEHPDVISKLKIIALTAEIPNGPIATRHDLPDDVELKLVGALAAFARTAEGRKALLDLYNMTGLTVARDSDYDGVRETLKELHKTIQEMVPRGDAYYRTYMVPGLE